MQRKEQTKSPVAEVTDIRKVFIDVPSAGSTAAHTPMTYIKGGAHNYLYDTEKPKQVPNMRCDNLAKKNQLSSPS